MVEEYTSNPYVIYVEPEFGNHFGFYEGGLFQVFSNKTSYTYPAKVALEFFNIILNENNNENKLHNEYKHDIRHGNKHGNEKHDNKKMNIDINVNEYGNKNQNENENINDENNNESIKIKKIKSKKMTRA